MELLLNLVWIAVAVAAFTALARMQRAPAQMRQIHGARYTNALLALACVLVLLFPIISASDDLHPSQAVLEDATKRIQQGIVSLEWSCEVTRLAALVPRGVCRVALALG